MQVQGPPLGVSYPTLAWFRIKSENCTCFLHPLILSSTLNTMFVLCDSCIALYKEMNTVEMQGVTFQRNATCGTGLPAGVGEELRSEGPGPLWSSVAAIWKFLCFWTRGPLFSFCAGSFTLRGWLRPLVRVSSFAVVACAFSGPWCSFADQN